MFRVEDALQRLTAALGGPDWRDLLAFLPPDLAMSCLRRSALAAHLAASLELARDGVIELSQTSPVRADLPAAPALNRGMDRELGKRILEALLFAADGAARAATIQAHLPGGLHAGELLDELAQDYAERGVRLERRGGGSRSAPRPTSRPICSASRCRARRLSRAALETLAIIAYQQPITRAEIEAMRGVASARGRSTAGRGRLGAPKGRRETPGRPVTWVTTPAFLDQFALASLDDLPRLDELLQGGLLVPAPRRRRGELTASRRRVDGDEDAAGRARRRRGPASRLGLTSPRRHRTC